MKRRKTVIKARNRGMRSSEWKSASKLYRTVAQLTKISADSGKLRTMMDLRFSQNSTLLEDEKWIIAILDRLIPYLEQFRTDLTARRKEVNRQLMMRQIREEIRVEEVRTDSKARRKAERKAASRTSRKEKDEQAILQKVLRPIDLED